MKKQRGSQVSVVIIVVPLIAAIVLAVFMAYINISKWPRGVQINFSWQSEEMAELKDKLQLSFDALRDRLEGLQKN